MGLFLENVFDVSKPLSLAAFLCAELLSFKHASVEFPMPLKTYAVHWLRLAMIDNDRHGSEN